MSHFASDVQHKTSNRIVSVIPNFIESDNPKFVDFIKAYYRFLEQYDEQPLKSTFETQDGLVSVQLSNSTVVGVNTAFSTAISVDQRIRVGSDIFRVRSIANNTSLVVYDVPVRSYYANTYSTEVDKTERQASGALRQVLTFHDVENTLTSFIPYFRDTYMRDFPQGTVDTKVLIDKVLDFYQSKGSEESFRFLFRALYGLEIDISYPGEYVWTTSDGVYESARTIRLSRRNPEITWSINSTAAPSDLLEMRQIVGLTSNARATVLRALDTFDGPKAVTALSVSDLVLNRTVGNVLLNSDLAEDDGNVLLFTDYGTPPEGLRTVVYEYNAVQQLATNGDFIPGETVSTVPETDPLAITGVIVGTVVGFPVVDGGSGYSYGDLIYPSGNTNGGYGAVGRVVGFANVDITAINIVDGGEGYYAGISLVVDNSGTGGSGLAGYVGNVSPGNLILHYDGSANVADGDILTFTAASNTGAIVEYEASREKIDYYEIGVALEDLFDVILLNSDMVEDDGDNLLFDDEYGTDWTLCIGSVELNNNASYPGPSGEWGLGNTLSVLYGANLATKIVTLTSQFTAVPIYVNGVRTEVGEIFTVVPTSFGSNYLTGVPTISVPRTFTPTDQLGNELSETIVPFEVAELVANVAIGQIGAVEVVAGGSGYSVNDSFSVGASETSSSNGSGAVLGMTLGAVSETAGRVIGTKSQTSADRVMQDIDRYNPFSYVLTVERDKTDYEEAIRTTVHPAGGLLITEHTITAVVDVPMTAETLVGDLLGEDVVYPVSTGSLSV